MSKPKEQSSWDLEGVGIESDDPITRLTGMKPYKRSQDSKGHGTPLAAWFPKDVDRTVSRILEKGPYQTKADVTRDAIWIGLIVLHLRFEADPEWTAYMQLCNIENEAKWEGQIYDEEDSFASHMDKLCNSNQDGVAADMVEERFKIIKKQQNSIKRIEALKTCLHKYRLGNLLKDIDVPESE